MVTIAVTALITHAWWRPHAASPSFHRLTYQRGVVSNARFAPGGKQVVYSAMWEGSPYDVFEVDADRAISRSLGLPGMSLAAVSSNMLAVAGNLGYRTDTYQARKLMVVPRSGGAPRAVAEDVSLADWAPDGQTLAVVTHHGSENRIEMPPGHVIARTTGYPSVLRVSPDGHRLAFVERTYTDSRGCVVVLDDQGKLVLRTREWLSVLSLAWAPGGAEVWFAAQTEEDDGWGLRAISMQGRVRTVFRGPWRWCCAT